MTRVLVKCFLSLLMFSLILQTDRKRIELILHVIAQSNSERDQVDWLLAIFLSCDSVAEKTDFAITTHCKCPSFSVLNKNYWPQWIIINYWMCFCLSYAEDVPPEIIFTCHVANRQTNPSLHASLHNLPPLQGFTGSKLSLFTTRFTFKSYTLFFFNGLFVNLSQKLSIMVEDWLYNYPLGTAG